jgi:dihydroflavonol-4-reductase
MSTVLVTGGTGFLGAHTIARLLADGHTVRTTIRTLSRSGDVLEMLRTAAAPNADSVSFFAADLTRDAGWAEAVAGADYVIHVASPFPGARPKDENELIVPARDGALRVLRAARDAGVKRVVMTSSFAAIGYGHGKTERVFTEADWTRLDGADVTPYIRSKAVAERAAWDFVDTEGGGLELTVINPVGIFGPILGPDFSSSINIVRTMLDGGMRVAPPIFTNVVDVRDAADLHVRAMTAPNAAGERFLALSSGGPVSFQRMAAALRAGLDEAASQAPRSSSPTWLIRLISLFVPALRELVPQLDVRRRASNQKAIRELGWQPRTVDEVVVATGESLIRLGRLG